ncbi:MAG: hypothetical protein U0L10_02770 [Lachnospiraceae bacterium]|uniref:hypothetical protein n=1 Tax=Sarcina sp. DSM 11001 TaxID=1798184 RepID=UPI001587AEE2|nr:hypothetical protein [Sarcina sp. DSM 11001]MEE1039626.1 hypothetical protein [Lachnospiraceae bacterium]
MASQLRRLSTSGYKEVLAKHNKSVIESYDLVETDTELFISERVNNLLFRKNRMRGHV